jgi:iron complex outermembrane recepter protein
MKILIAVFLLLTIHNSTHAQETDSLKVLENVTVTDTRSSYKADKSSPTLRVAGSLINQPQNIIRVSRRFIEDRGLLDLRSTASSVSGINYGYSNNALDAANTVNIRGFLTTNNFFRNGLNGGGAYSGGQEDEAFIESIEYIKGPAAFLQTNGEPAGFINVNTKQPLTKKILTATLQGGGFNFYRASADIGTALKSKGFSFRFNTAFQDNGSFMGNISNRRFAAAPVVRYDFNSRTYVLAEYNVVVNRQSGGDFTKVTNDGDQLKDDRSTNIGTSKQLPVSKATDQMARLMVSHELNSSWKLTSQVSWRNTPAESWSLFSDNYAVVNFADIDGNPTDVTSRVAARSKNKFTIFNAQAFVNGKWNLSKKISSTFLAGFDYSNRRDSTDLTFGTSFFPLSQNNLDLSLNPEAVRELDTAPFFNGDNRTHNWGVYLTNQFLIANKFGITVGGRFSGYHNIRVSDDRKTDERAFTPRVALNYLFNKSTSVYALYDQSFIPQFGQSFNKEIFKPVRGNSFEVGFKKNWLNERLITSLSIFNVEKQNVLTSDVMHPGFFVQLGKVRSRGIEIDILGEISKQVSVVANYAFTDAEVTEDADSSFVGNNVWNTPRQMINTWLMLKPGGTIKGFQVGIGQTSVIDRGSNDGDITLPNYTRFDATLAYQRNKYKIAVFLENLFDKRYMEGGDALRGYPYSGVNWYYQEGRPLSFRIALEYRFW